jgi:hypothetical protein
MATDRNSLSSPSRWLRSNAIMCRAMLIVQTTGTGKCTRLSASPRLNRHRSIIRPLTRDDKGTGQSAPVSPWLLNWPHNAPHKRPASWNFYYSHECIVGIARKCLPQNPFTKISHPQLTQTKQNTEIPQTRSTSQALSSNQERDSETDLHLILKATQEQL